MNLLVTRAFDVVDWLSSFLDALFLFIARGDSDFSAAMVAASCMIVIAGCHRVLVQNCGFGAGVTRVAARACAMLIGYAVVLHLGTRVITLKNERIHPADGHAFRCSLPQAQADELASSSWLLISASGRFSPQRWMLADPRMKKVSSITRVAHDGGGGYLLRGKSIYFSTPDGGPPVRADGGGFLVVRERAWFVAFRAVLVAGCLGFALWLLMRPMIRPLRRMCAQVSGERALLAALCGFAVFFGCHQWRFVSQDARMQRITSRFDDGYMLERLEESARLKTMDPMRLDNKAYGAIGFYPFALLPYAAAHLGVTPPVEALNVYARGLKLLLSVCALGAVWLLGTRHFGRVPAIAAVLLVATNPGFLGYSSYPFYPDVAMALFSTLSLCFLLDLTSRWSARSFFLSLACAAMSVSIKFLTFLLFPFIFLVAAVALWREHGGRRNDFFRASLRLCGGAAILCVAVFFLCNPYLDYNRTWIVPNYKMCGSYYSAETPVFVAGAAARVSTWLDLCFRSERDSTDLIAALLALVVALVVVIRLLGSCASARRPSWRWPGGAWSGAGVLLLFGLVFQGYLMRSMTLSEGIDRRLLLPLYPLIGVAAAWGVVLFVGAACAAARPVRPLIGVAVTLGVALFAAPRIRHAADFFRFFGRQPQVSPISDWLAAADVPPHAWIVNGLRSCIPAKWDNLSDGIWLPKAVDQALHRLSTLPAVLIEDESCADAGFSAAAAERGFNAPEQQAIHEAGRALYTELRRNAMTPFVLVHKGEEFTGANAIHHIQARFGIYANPLAFSVNLADQATMTLVNGTSDQAVRELPVKEPGALLLRWAAPVTVGTIHVSTVRKACPDVMAKLELADGKTETLPVRGLGNGDAEVTQRLLRLDTPRDIRGVTLVSFDGAPYAAGLIGDVNVHPPVPIGLNATSRWFEPQRSVGADDGLAALIALRPMSHPGVPVPPEKPARFVLKRQIPCEVGSTRIVFDAAPAGNCSARCAYVFADGTRRETEGVEERTLSPGHVYFTFGCPPGGDVERIECSVASKTGATLRQIHVDAKPRTVEAPR